MAKTLTWGTGGTYSSLVSAWNAAVWDDDIIFEQVGAASQSTLVGHKEQNGYTATIQGNGDTLTTSTFLFYMNGTQATGNIYIQDLVVDQNYTNGYIFRVVYTGAPTSYVAHIRRCKFTTTTARVMWVDNLAGGYSEVNMYACECTSDASATSALFDISANAIVSGTSVYVEDIRFTTPISNVRTIFKSGSSSIAGTIDIKRIYCDGFNADATLTDATTVTALGAFASDMFTSYSDTNLPVGNTGLAFSTDNFLSVTPADPDFGIPKQGSPVYDDASQTSNIADNILGLNDVAVDYRAAGPYTPETQIQPPTGMAYTTEATGIKVTWTPYSPAQTGYEDVGVYYETIPDESAFTTLRATVLKGTNEYTIPYSELTSAPLWYVRLTHRPEA